MWCVYWVYKHIATPKMYPGVPSKGGRNQFVYTFDFFLFMWHTRVLIPDQKWKKISNVKLRGTYIRPLLGSQALFHPRYFFLDLRSQANFSTSEYHSPTLCVPIKSFNPFQLWDISQYYTIWQYFNITHQELGICTTLLSVRYVENHLWI